MMGLFSIALTLWVVTGGMLVDRSGDSGVEFVHQNRATGDRWLPETMGAGVVVADFDGDGHLDLVFLDSGQRFAHLYRGGAGFRFEASEGIDFTGDGFGMGGLAEDFDGDGHIDLLITALEGGFICYGDGDFGFTPPSQLAEGWCTAASALDFDGDGDSDLFIGRYVEWSPQSDLWCTLDGETKSYCTPEVYAPTRGMLLRNDGGRSFTMVEDFEAPTKALGSVAVDVDDDGWTDLLVANDTMPDLYLRNLAGAGFEELGLASGMALSREGMARAGMGIDAAQLIGEARIDLAVGHFAAEASGIYRNAGENLFLDEAQLRGLDAPTRGELTFGLLILDLNLDGRRDLITANGHIEPDIQNFRPGQRWRQPLGIYLQRDDGGFDAVDALEAGEFVARGLAHGDFDGDGDPDLVFTQNGGPPVLLENASEFERVIVVRDLPPGASIQLRTNRRTLRGDLRVGNSYLSCSEPVVRFALARGERAQDLTIRRPTGSASLPFPVDDGAHIFTISAGRMP